MLFIVHSLLSHLSVSILTEEIYNTFLHTQSAYSSEFEK